MTESVASLALSLVSNPGAYVLLLGSGVSRAAGIPTGWEVVESLIGRLAVADGQPVPTDPAAWYEARTGSRPTYTALIESLAPRAAERTGLLAGFFEATPAERDLGVKQPSPAHRAIAELVLLGIVRVIVTTNFDRLLERALVDVGIDPTVVSSDDDIAGMPPLTQVRCLIVKAHGDFRDTRIRNTPDEVAALDPGISTLLESLFRDYGLIVSGWSADYDLGLRQVMIAAGKGRYGATWTSRSDLSGEAAGLAASLGATSIRVTDADGFFTALLEAVRSVRDLVKHGPLEDEVAVATAKRYLVNPEGRIALSDLINAEVERVRSLLETGRPTSMTSAEEFRDWLDRLRAGSQQLVRLYATVGFWGQPGHIDILIRGIERLTRWGVEGGIVIVLESRLFPPLLALYGAGVSAVAARNYGSLAPLIRTRIPHTNPRYPSDEDTLPVPLVLNGPQVLDHKAMNGVLNIGVAKPTNYYTPPSVYLEQILRPLVADVIPGAEEYERAFDTFEALLAIRYILDGGRGLPTGSYAYRGQRSFVGRGVPERLQSELNREGAGWPPIVGGLFDDVEQATSGIAGLIERLSKFSWD
jgi:hypothetical protein